MGCKLVLGQTGLVFVVARGHSWEENVSAQQSKKTGRCTRHGGKSTGPRTQVGRNKIVALHTIHGKYTKAKRQEAQKSAEVGRRVRAEVKLIEICLIEQGVLDRNSM